LHDVAEQAAFLSVIAIHTVKSGRRTVMRNRACARSNTPCVSAHTIPLLAPRRARAKSALHRTVRQLHWDGTTVGSKETAMEMNTRAMAFRIGLLTLTVAAPMLVAANERLSIRVSPATSFAPADLVIVTRIEPDASNRAVEIVADSSEFYRSSTVQLKGDRGPKTTRFEFRSLPAGDYEVRAAVIGTDGQPAAIARGHVHVVPSAGSR
jgi:hypothetical protein